MHKILRTTFVAASFAAFLACGKSPTQPDPAPPPAPAPVPAPATPLAKITSIGLSGPATISPGSTGEFTAVAQRADGSSDDVTAAAGWSFYHGPSYEDIVLRHLNAGTLEATAHGENYVAAVFDGTTSNWLPVLALEPGTFKVSGTVADIGIQPSGFSQLNHALVEIVSGTGAGLRATSNYRGYTLYGAAGDIELRASADDYAPQVSQVRVTSDATQNFVLTPIVTPADVSGLWVITLSASPACRAILPAAAGERIFETTITETGTHLNTTPASSTAFSRSGDYEGRIMGQAFSLIINGDTGYGDYSYPDLFDRLNATQWLGIYGTVKGTVTGSEIRATFDGHLDLFDGAPAGKAKILCHATDHTVVLRRK